MHAMVEVRALPRSKEQVGFLRDAGVVWRSSSAHVISHVHNRASRSVEQCPFRETRWSVAHT